MYILNNSSSDSNKCIHAKYTKRESSDVFKDFVFKAKAKEYCGSIFLPFIDRSSPNLLHIYASDPSL